jgi:hypothetical protein
MISRRNFSALALSTVFASAFAITGPATEAGQSLANPDGKPILSIEGRITVVNTRGKAVFDRQMLEAMDMVSITTSTPWFDNPVTFEGVALKDLMTRVDASGETVVAIALNDYRTTIPLADFYERGAILAIKRDGNYMPISDKGPLFIVYPYDSDPALQSQKYYGRSVWQLSRLIIE